MRDNVICSDYQADLCGCDSSSRRARILATDTLSPTSDAQDAPYRLAYQFPWHACALATSPISLSESADPPNLGQQPLPFFVAPAGLARLGHPDGELNIVRGVAEHDVVQVVSSGASASIDEIFGAKQPDQTLFWQLYLPGDREAGAKKIKHAVELGARAIFVTADVPVLGKRERDLKLKARSQSYEHPIAAVRTSAFFTNIIILTLRSAAMESGRSVRLGRRQAARRLGHSRQ